MGKCWRGASGLNLRRKQNAKPPAAARSTMTRETAHRPALSRPRFVIITASFYCCALPVYPGGCTAYPPAGLFVSRLHPLRARSVDSQVAQEELTAFGVHRHEAAVGLRELVRLPGHGVLHELDLRPARLHRTREDNPVVEVDVHVVVALHQQERGRQSVELDRKSVV